MVQKQNIAIVFLAASMALPRDAQSSTLKTFLDAVRDHHPLFIETQLDVSLARNVKRRYSASRDPMVEVGPFLSHKRPPEQVTFSVKRHDTVGSQLRVRKNVWQTGGRLGVEWSYNRTELELKTDLSDPSLELLGIDRISRYHQNAVRISYSQPLLRNARGILDRMAFDLQDDVIAMTELQVKETQEDFLATLAKQYWQWVFSREQLRSLRIQHERATALKQEVKKRWEAHFADRLDHIRAVDYVQQLDRAIAVAQATCLGQQAELTALVNIYLDPVDDLFALTAIPSTHHVKRLLKSQSRTLALLHIKKKNKQAALERYRNNALPELNLSMEGALKQNNSKWQEVLRPDQPEWLVAVQFKMPIGNTSARADIEKTQLQIQKLDAEIASVRLRLMSALDNILVLVDRYKAILDAGRTAIALAKAKTHEEMLRYRRGRSDLSIVIQSQNGEEDVNIAHARHALTYQTLIIEYRSIMDQLLEL